MNSWHLFIIFCFVLAEALLLMRVVTIIRTKREATALPKEVREHSHSTRNEQAKLRAVIRRMDPVDPIRALLDIRDNNGYHRGRGV